jgi:hypothetical protein
MFKADAVSSTLASAYTYLGQFIVHDIVLTKAVNPTSPAADPCTQAPLPPAAVRAAFDNKRTAFLELESVYGQGPNHLDIVGKPIPLVGDELLLGKVSIDIDSDDDAPDFDLERDLPREAMSSDPEHDRAARIADPRNDESLILGQLHLAFMRAHNTLVRRGKTFAEARTLLRQHYQWMVINDFLKQVADPVTVEQVLSAPLYKPEEGEFFIPLEFSVAACRFGHSMSREVYYLSKHLTFASLKDDLFTRMALGQQRPQTTTARVYETLPKSHVVEWEHFVLHPENKGKLNLACKIDTGLVRAFFSLSNEGRQPKTCKEMNLAVLDLKRGYIQSLPTGQAVAQALGLTPLTEAEILKVAVNSEQRAVLEESELSVRTPLWFYILAEAAQEAHGSGNSLGPVGSRIVAEVLIGLVRKTPDSFLNDKSWSPTLTGDHFYLSDLLRLAGMLK